MTNVDRFTSSKLAIIGGGISGTALSRLLQLKGESSVTLIEKSRRLGGRASLITLPNSSSRLAIGVHRCKINLSALPKPKHIISSEQLIHNLGWQTAMLQSTGQDSEIEYELQPDAWPEVEQKLSSSGQAISINLSHHVKSLHFDFDQQIWILKGEYWHEQSKQIFEHHTERLVLSIPPQQAVNLLETAQKTHSNGSGSTKNAHQVLSDLIHKLKRVNNQAQWVIVLRLSEDLLSKFSQKDIAKSKIVKEFKCITKSNIDSLVNVVMHTHPEWARANIEVKPEMVASLCLAELSQLLSDSYALKENAIEALKVHRWRFASTTLNEEIDHLYLSSLKLGLCGEAMLPGVIENGVQRALHSAIELYSEINLST